ncbi:hypothetical protein G6N05_07120 [Flavobacterium sp. F372]|uniref:CD-NTase-associated protein 15 domain-containing protein n=1 Tax=Flavobacterium bernardetii TaxID=2813823 RepID=A0ABR7IXX3_9FLAO|nr:hypothetical protein [Flavobacterium bernardetii]MBC5834484.1 hypothetical protein [Flavobacterium bernardetii]NHF69877.1 hypothetical protein [Flavobacterium bernardetii]
MEKDYFKYYKPNFLIYLIVGLFVLIYSIKKEFVLSISITSLLSVIIFFITQYFWKYSPFKYFFWIEDFSGRYEGKIIYQYNDENGNLKIGVLNHVKIISQSGSRITVYSFTIKSDGKKSSLSVNKGMYVEKTEDEKHFRLIYNYLNEGSLEQDFSPHYGTEIIKIIKKGDDKIIEGNYYTDRKPFQTKGRFEEMKWISNDDNHEF